MHDLIDTCMKATGRKYPSGYGFALAYLDQNPGPDMLKAMRDRALKVAGADAKAGGDDGWRFIKAYAESNQSLPAKGWPWFLIEAAQLVLADAIAGRTGSRAVMRQWGHPGY